MRLKTERHDARAIAFHYDVSNEFYALFLDRRMVYTCAYYRRPDGDLDQAQEDKLDLVCRKLRLARGERRDAVGGAGGVGAGGDPARRARAPRPGRSHGLPRSPGGSTLRQGRGG